MSVALRIARPIDGFLTKKPARRVQVSMDVTVR
jgi:hypothetical protein